jgi:hypothetical protein
MFPRRVAPRPWGRHFFAGSKRRSERKGSLYVLLLIRPESASALAWIRVPEALRQRFHFRQTPAHFRQTPLKMIFNIDTLFVGE